MKWRLLLFITMNIIMAPRTAYQSALPAVIKIAPYGNSITQAAGDHQSYRYPLWKKLIDAEISFDFVGSLNTNFGGNPSRPDYKGTKFDLDHEGHWGWRADEILNKPNDNINNWLSKYTPDMVLVHLGTNDCIQGQDKNSTLSEITQVVEKLRADNPDVVIFLASLIPCNASGAPARITDLNNGIKPLANQLNTEKSPVIFVDQYAGFTSGGDQSDGIHPNAAGEEKMAQKWFDAIQNYLTATRSKSDIAVYTPPVSAKALTHRLELYCPQRSLEQEALTILDGSIINLL